MNGRGYEAVPVRVTVEDLGIEMEMWYVVISQGAGTLHLRCADLAAALAVAEELGVVLGKTLERVEKYQVMKVVP